MMSHHMQIEVILSCKSFPMPGARWNLAEELGCTVLLALMATKAGFVSEVDPVTDGFLASVGTSVSIYMFASRSKFRYTSSRKF